MIKKIHIANVATINDMTIFPYQVNYIFGGNGAGKTTISNYLADSCNYSNGTIERDDSCDVLVYNKNFVDGNFQDKNAIQGIFTIGESAVETVAFIEEQEAKKREIEVKIKEYAKSLSVLQGKIDGLVNDFEDNCWLVKKELEVIFPLALTGYRKVKKIFADKCLECYKSDFSEYDLVELTNIYNQLFQKEVHSYEKLSELVVDIGDEQSKYSSLKEIEQEPFFACSLVKSNESNFSQVIDKLKIFDWVGQGVRLIDDAKICPFCQQKLPQNVLCELENLFDQTYRDSIEQIKKLLAIYENGLSQIDKYLTRQTEYIQSIPFLDSTELTKRGMGLMSVLDENIIKIKEKLQSPSNSVVLLDSSGMFVNLFDEISRLNKLIEDNNEAAKNISRSKNTFVTKLWDYISNVKLHSAITQFKKDLNGQNIGMAKIKGYKLSAEQDINTCNALISEKRASVVCIDNAISEINSLLTGFGFNGFKIEKKDDISYKLVRQDGSEVKETLSEGEHRFITFLYFYQLVKGTLDKDSTNKDKILVIDDPISSLDSNILFIVSYLVRELIAKCLNGSNVKQVFILTHNIYFHQEVAFKGNRHNSMASKERFWLLRKVNECTSITEFEKNQIHSSYDLLWQELKNPNTEGALICNTMRRILEHYYKVIGHLDYEKIIDSFDGQDKLICKTLLPFINTGSHIINDDLHLSLEGDMIDKYKNIFRLIFEKTNQICHYNMMMGIDESAA